MWFHSLRLSFFVTLGRCVKSFFFWAMEVLTMEVSSFVPPTNKKTNKKKQSFHWQEKGFHKCQLWQIKSPLLNGINPLLCFRSPHRRVYRSRRKTLNPEQVFFFIAGSTNSTVWSFCFFFFFLCLPLALSHSVSTSCPLQVPSVLFFSFQIPQVGALARILSIN